MRLILLAAAAISFASSAWASQPGASPALATATGAAAQPATAATPAADKVYPPLPTLAMLPPSSGDDDDMARPHATGHKKKPHRSDCRCSAPAARLVVSDASRAYLQGVERQLDVALAR